MKKERVISIIKSILKMQRKKRVYTTIPDVPSFLQKYVQGGI